MVTLVGGWPVIGEGFLPSVMLWVCGGSRGGVEYVGDVS